MNRPQLFTAIAFTSLWLTNSPAAAAPVDDAQVYGKHFKKHYCPTRGKRVGSHRIAPSGLGMNLVSGIDEVDLVASAKTTIDAEVKKLGYRKITDLQYSAFRIAKSLKNDLWSIVEVRFTAEGREKGTADFRQCALSVVFPADASKSTGQHFELLKHCQIPRQDLNFDPMESPMGVAGVYDVVDALKCGNNDFILEIAASHGSILVAYRPAANGWKEQFRGCGIGD